MGAIQQILAGYEAASVPQINVAAVANGATVIATSTLEGDVNAVIRDLRTCAAIYDGGWVSNDDPSVIPQDVTITFDKNYSISEIDLVGVTQAGSNAVNPASWDISSIYPPADFKIQYWNGSSFADLASITGNTSVWKRFIFSPVTTNQIRAHITAGQPALANAVLCAFQAWPTRGNPNTIVCEGDSLTAIAVTPSWVQQIQPTYSQLYAFYDIATGGETVETMLAQYSTQALPLYNANSVKNLLCIFGGTNDVLGGGSASINLQTNYQTYCQNGHADGFKMIAQTIQAMGPSAISPTQQAVVDSFNTWIRANYQAIGCAALVDWYTDSRLTDPLDLTYFVSDEVHNTELGQTVRMSLVQTAVNTIIL